jgi:hypothetical protein
MLHIHNSLISSLYDTYPEFIGLFLVWYASREEANTFWIRIIQGRGQWILDTYHTGKRLMNSGYVSYIRIQNSLASSLYDTYPKFTGLFPVWYASRMHWPLPCMIRIHNSPASSLDLYHTGKRPINSRYVSYREEAIAFWMRILQGRGQWNLDMYHTGKRPVSSWYWPLPCMIRIHNSPASSLYDTYPDFIGLFPVWYVSNIHVSYREEASEFWMRIIQGRGQWILDTCHTGKRPMNSWYVSYREEASEFL